jgi:hypothetical protein
MCSVRPTHISAFLSPRKTISFAKGLRFSAALREILQRERGWSPSEALGRISLSGHFYEHVVVAEICFSHGAAILRPHYHCYWGVVSTEKAPTVTMCGLLGADFLAPAGKTGDDVLKIGKG